MSRLTADFFEQHHLEVAKNLLGCTLFWDGAGGRIVETEAYAALDDPACHTSFRPSAREFFEANRPGTVYAFINYGMHWLLNVLAADGIVLIRAIEPTHGIRKMSQRRNSEVLTALCSGPGKLGQAIALSGSDHGTSLLTARRHIRARDDEFNVEDIAADARVGLSQALDRPWRFLVRNNPHVSVPHGKALSKKRPPRKLKKYSVLSAQCCNMLPSTFKSSTSPIEPDCV